MDTLQNLKTFLAIARTENFSAAARQIGVAPSVVTKRINQLEHQMSARLFNRSTRKVNLTETGEKYLPKVRDIIRDFDNVIAGTAESSSELEGHLRIKTPTTTATTFLGPIFSSFQKTHPGITLDVALLDRSVNPIEEGFDMALGALPTTFRGVVDVPLCAYPRIICASPEYLERAGTPTNPGDLIDHDCLTATPTGSTWSFESHRGPINISVHSKYNANDSVMLFASALDGNGITIIPNYIADPAIADGTLVTFMEDFPVANYWLKALVPESRMKIPRVDAMLEWLKQELSPAPWEKEGKKIT
ncbi:MAG: LysR family transcriptional regulator [Rhodospirillaceae bacterium]|nr:LysR family transcriptional regulator [Rhodospirillaceae bacterium]